MWRSVVLTLSNNMATRQLVTKNPFGRRAAQRFVAGETIADAVAAARELNRRDASVELDYLGEHVSDATQAKQAMRTYLAMLDKIAVSGIDSHVSVKASQMGQDVNEDLCFDNISKVIERAAATESFVWMDMEGSNYTERTIELYKRLRAQHENVGLALQAYLHRTKADAEDIISIGGTVRLCKGAYSEPHDVAFAHKSDVDGNYAALTELLLGSGHFHAIATHDEMMIRHAVEFARSHALDRQAFEFQMLYGVRRDLERRFAAEGRRLRLYVPFGSAWYPYFMRRLAERPANLFFLLKNLLRG